MRTHVRGRRHRRRAALASAGALVAACLAAAPGCGSDAVGVGACRQVEEARCRAAPACGITLEPPYHTSGSDVDACIRYYDTACLHGLTVGDPGGPSVQACVAAIAGGDCALVRFPVTGACAWLAPVGPAPPGDAAPDDGAAPADANGATDADATDAGATDAGATDAGATDSGDPGHEAG